jgi:hypothetical protein
MSSIHIDGKFKVKFLYFRKVFLQRFPWSNGLVLINVLTIYNIGRNTAAIYDLFRMKTIL